MSESKKRIILAENFDNYRKYWLILSIFWMIFIFILSTSLFSPQSTAKVTDKITTEINFRFIAHLVVYFILGFLASGSIRLNFSFNNKFLFTVLVCFLYGVSDEFHQYFEPARKFRSIDIITNSGGSLTGILSYYLVYLRLKRK